MIVRRFIPAESFLMMLNNLLVAVLAEQDSFSAKSVKRFKQAVYIICFRLLISSIR